MLGDCAASAYGPFLVPGRALWGVDSLSPRFRFKKDDLVEVRWENEKGEVKWEPTTIVNTPNMFNKNYKICWQKKVGDVYEPIWVTKEKGEYSS